MKGVLAVALLWPVIALAEVSDKMPTITGLVSVAAVVAIVFFSLGYVRWWLSLLGLPVAALFTAGSVSLWLEEGMRRALLHEQGWQYFGAHAAQDTTIVLGAVVGAWFWRRR